MLDRVSGAGSPVATAGWGTGLTLGGLFVAAGAIAYMADYQGLATRNIESMIEQRREFFFRPSRQVTPRQLRQIRYTLGLAFFSWPRWR